MCGIAGVVKFEAHAWDDAARRSLEKMSEAIAHRGPDGAGWYADPNGRIVLMHRRLAIIDLPGGVQPMTNETGRVHVVFNGEIYNHAELRKELIAAGHQFRTDHSDTEVLVHGWEEWGTELPGKLVGMFAFAVWDERAETFFMARDRMGQKPLFYATLEDGLVFGSTIASVQGWHEVPRRVPMEQIGLYFLLGYFPGPQTVWRDVSQVLPGAWVRVRKDVVDGKKYWTATSNESRAKSRDLRSTLQNAVESQLMSDVPLACFLSGGIDSSIVAALMQEIMRKRGGDSIHTLSVGFAESAFDETHFAETVAKKIGSRHTRLEVSPAGDVLGTLRKLMRETLGQPFADSSILPTYQLSKAVRGLATVALSGDGADELFGGYDRYRAMAMLSRWKGLARLAPKSIPLGSLAKRERYRRFAAAARADLVSERYTRLVEIFPLELAEELLGHDIMDWYAPPEEYGANDDVSPMRLAMVRDQQEYLPGDVLWKVDSASMAVALEVRSPFLDHRVVELANQLPDDALIRGGAGKWILRETFANELPPEVKGRGKKGFAVPVGEWFKTQLLSSLTDLLFSANSFTTHYLHKATAERLVQEHLAGTRDHTHRLFALLMLELWAAEFKPAME